MGICSSCLGRKRSSPQDDDNSRLLLDDPHAVNYGSFGDQNPGTSQADPQDMQRETEALQKIVAQTSNHLVDIFAMVPQTNQRPTAPAFLGKDARLIRYQDVLAKLSTGEISGQTTDPLERAIPHDALDWGSDDGEEDDQNVFKVLKGNETGPLIGGFAEVEKSIK